jgi:hypothetical protein
VGGAGHAVRLGRATITLAADGTGPVLVDVPWSRWLTVSAGACLRRNGSTVAVVPSRAGTYALTSSYDAPWAGRNC